MTWWNPAIPPGLRRNRAIRGLIKDTVAGVRTSNHSALGATLPILIEAFEKAKVPYRIDAVPGLGYTVTRFTPPFLLTTSEGED